MQITFIKRLTVSGCVCVLESAGWRKFSLRLRLGILQSHHWCLRPLWGHRRGGLTRLQANSVHKAHVSVKSPAGPAGAVRNKHWWAFLDLWLWQAMTSDSAHFWPWALHSTGSAAAADGKQRIRVQIRRTVPITAEITDNKTDILDFIILFTHLSKWQRMIHVRLFITTKGFVLR